MSTPIYVFVVGADGQQVPLSAGPERFLRAMYPVKCKPSFPLQYLAVWRVQGVVTKHQLFPPQPRDIQLTPPPLTQQASIDTSGKPDKKTRSWQGVVQYNVYTAAEAHITGAQVEPVSQDKADVKAAQGVSVVEHPPGRRYLWNARCSDACNEGADCARQSGDHHRPGGRAPGDDARGFRAKSVDWLEVACGASSSQPADSFDPAGGRRLPPAYCLAVDVIAAGRADAQSRRH